MRAASIFACALLLGMMSDGTSRAQDVPELEIPGVHARLFLDIQKLAPCDKAAPESLTADCLESIWSIVDITGDGLLSFAEINRFVRIVAGGAAYEAYVNALEAFDASRKSDPAAESAGLHGTTESLPWVEFHSRTCMDVLCQSPQNPARVESVRSQSGKLTFDRGIEKPSKSLT